MSYVGGFVAAVPTATKEAFLSTDPRMLSMSMSMPFDVHRMIFGGFKVILRI